jgi:hypothetical protein
MYELYIKIIFEITDLKIILPILNDLLFNSF